MNLLGNREFAVVLCAPEGFRGARFRRRGAAWSIASFAADDDPEKGIGGLLERIGCGRGTELYLTGALRGGVFFSAVSAALSVRDQRSAMEMELVRRLPRIPEQVRLSFLASEPDAGGAVRVDVYAFPAESLAPVVESGARKIDEFIFPLLGRGDASEAIYLPEIEPGFFRRSGAWRPVSGADDEIKAGTAFWKEKLLSFFQAPPEFRFEPFFAVLLVASLVAEGTASRESAALRTIPEPMRPARFRSQLKVTVILVLLLILNLVWSAFRVWGGDYREFKETKREVELCKEKISSIRAKLRRGARSQKEMARIAGLKAGERDVLEKLAAFSKNLPENVLVSNLRWSDSGIDLMMQSENATVNFPAAIRPLSYWKISQLQQRQGWNSDVTTITLRLVPNTEAVSGRRK